jgi:hypothetical protein
MTRIQVGVRQLGSRTRAWVMVPAQEVMANIYLILDNNLEEDIGCELEFKPGNLVMVVDHREEDGTEFPVAMRLYAGILP